jgi:hypothetical protein
LATTTASRGAEAPDLAKVDRHIGKQPKYTSDRPLYGLFVFGPEARTRVWLVLDKSSKDSKNYDVLYIDRNASGDLTESGKRVVGKADPQYGFVVIDAGDVTDPQTKEKHHVRVFSEKDKPVGAFVQWKNKHIVSCGFDESGPDGTMQFTPDPSTAPVFWPGGETRLAFQRRFWKGMDPVLRIDKENQFHVFLGHRGLGRNTYCALDEKYLPADTPVRATLVYTDRAGKERRVQAELRERC